MTPELERAGGLRVSPEGHGRDEMGENPVEIIKLVFEDVTFDFDNSKNAGRLCEVMGCHLRRKFVKEELGSD